ncbi:anhydro-N-acetylmuramic acid kinase [Sinomicrobium sp.]
MKRSIAKLYEISRKKSRLIVGLMSGTSLDGLDIALCRVEGHGQKTEVELLQFVTVPYSDGFRNSISEVFAKETGSIAQLCLLNPHIAEVHAAMILQALKNWAVQPEEVDLVASHGQTIYHAPKRYHERDEYSNATLQLGDGDHLAVKTGIITLSDFRQKHIAAGGEGAPLAAYGDYLLFSDVEESRVLLNIGGIANLTFLQAGAGFNEAFCTDTGPGNTLMDAYVKKHFDLPFDRDAKIARQGQRNEKLLKALLDHPFFKEEGSRTTGPELFNEHYIDHAQQRCAEVISPEDVLHTLAHFTVAGIVKCIRGLDCRGKISGFVSGGGASNPLLMELLREACPEMEFVDTSVLGLDPDAKEAVLFAILANETLAGSPELEGSSAYPWVSMGKISLPE